MDVQTEPILMQTWL